MSEGLIATCSGGVGWNRVYGGWVQSVNALRLQFHAECKWI